MLRIEAVFPHNEHTQTMDRIIDELLKLCATDHTVVLYPHVRADGDALGACFALVPILRKLQITPLVLLEEPVPDKFTYLPGLDAASVFLPETEPPEELLRQQIAVAVDSHGAERLLNRESFYDRAPVRMVLDHHVSEQPLHPLYYKDVRAAATCEIVTALVLRLEDRLNCSLLDAESAGALMSGLMTDTGRFSFSNVTAQTFAAAAKLKDYGVRMNDLSERLFDTMSPARLELIGLIAAGITYYYGGRLAVAQISLEDLRRSGAAETDLDGLAAMMRTVKGVDVALLLREAEGGEVRGNLRSNASFDSAAFARTLGGGGHVPAAGFTLYNTTLKAAWAHCVKAMKSSLGIKPARFPFRVESL